MKISCRDFLERIASINSQHLVLIDESGVNDNIIVGYEWLPKGQLSDAERKGSKNKQLSLITGYVDGKNETMTLV